MWAQRVVRDLARSSRSAIASAEAVAGGGEADPEVREDRSSNGGQSHRAPTRSSPSPCSSSWAPRVTSPPCIPTRADPWPGYWIVALILIGLVEVNALMGARGLATQKYHHGAGPLGCDPRGAGVHAAPLHRGVGAALMRHRLERAAALAAPLFLLVLVACSEAEEGLDPALERGRSAYLGTCVACHNANPTSRARWAPRWPTPPWKVMEWKVLRGEYPPGTEGKEVSGVMPRFPNRPVDPDIYAYVQYAAERERGDGEG